jgi:hypothetical protein
VSFLTLFLNIEVLSDKLNQEKTGKEEVFNLFDPPDTQYLESNPAGLLQPKQKAEVQPSAQKNISSIPVGKKEYPLFKLKMNPPVPSYILQGNYVVNAPSPQKDSVAYLYPDEWETVGDIYLRNMGHNSWSLLQLDQQARREMWDTQEPAQMIYTPKKKILWLNNEEFLTIIGYAYGTISTGGDLVKVSKTTGNAEMIYPAHDKEYQEVTDFEMSEGKLTLYIKVIDSNGWSKDNRVITTDLNQLDTLSRQ